MCKKLVNTIIVISGDQNEETPMRMGDPSIRFPSRTPIYESSDNYSLPSNTPRHQTDLNSSDIDLSSPLNYGTPRYV